MCARRMRSRTMRLWHWDCKNPAKACDKRVIVYYICVKRNAVFFTQTEACIAGFTPLKAIHTRGVTDTGDRLEGTYPFDRTSKSSTVQIQRRALWPSRPGDLAVSINHAGGSSFVQNRGNSSDIWGGLEV